MYIIANSSMSGGRTVDGKSGNFGPGDYAYDKLGIGSYSMLTTLDMTELEKMHVYQLVDEVYNADTHTVSSKEYSMVDGKLNVTNGVVINKLTLTKIPSKKVEEVKTSKLMALSQYRWEMANCDTTVTVDGVDYTVTMNETALNELTAALNQTDRETFNITTSNMKYYQVSRTVLQTILAHIVEQRQVARDKEYAHAEAINALTTNEEVENYSFTEGAW